VHHSIRSTGKSAVSHIDLNQKCMLLTHCYNICKVKTYSRNINILYINLSSDSHSRENIVTIASVRACAVCIGGVVKKFWAWISLPIFWAKKCHWLISSRLLLVFLNNYTSSACLLYQIQYTVVKIAGCTVWQILILTKKPSRWALIGTPMQSCL